MTIFPEFERQLVKLASASAQSGAEEGRGRVRLLRLPRGGMLVAVAAAAVAMTVGGIFLVGLHGAGGSGGPGPGPSASSGGPLPPKAWLKAGEAARGDVRSHDPACTPTSLRGAKPAHPNPQNLLQTAPGSELTSALGVLRQPAPASQQISSRRLRRLAVPAQGLYARYARHGRISGVDYYLVPVANTALSPPVPSRCLTEESTAFRHRVAHFAALQRAAALSWWQQVLRTERAMNKRPLPGVCVMVNSPVSQGGGCLPAMRLSSPPGLNRTGGGNHMTVTTLVVPDDVATVTAHYLPEHRVGQVPKPITVTHHVVGNVTIFVLSGGWDPPATLTYRSASGMVLWKTPSPPSP